MEYVRLGASGLKVSRICLGCMSYGDPRLADVGPRRGGGRAVLPARASRPGSTSSTPPTCTRRGAARRSPAALLRVFAHARRGRHRHQGLLPDGRPARTTAACRASTSWPAIDASLRRLGIDYVDLYQIHRFDPETPIEETLEALDDVVRAGKARYIGASSMYAWQFAKALHVAERHGWTRFVSMQNHYNLVYREEEREMIPLCLDEGVGVHPLEPARPRLPRRQPHARRRAAHDAARAATSSPTTMYDRRRLRRGRRGRARSPRDRGVPPAQVALAWLLGQPGVTAPIVGATKTRAPRGRARRRST